MMDFHTFRGYENMNSNKNFLTSSMEDYLEMIYRCSENEDFVRLNKIAQMLNVRDSSASKMMKKLGELGLIKYEKYGMIVLTEKGKAVGKYLLDRHNVIENFLMNVGSVGKVLKETELIEHAISVETVMNINMLNLFLSENTDVLIKFKAFKELKNKR